MKRTRGPLRLEPVPAERNVKIVGHRRQLVAAVWSGAVANMEMATANAQFLIMAEPLVEALRELIPWASTSVGPTAAHALMVARNLVRQADELTQGKQP